jgi:hypothetical protein
MRVNLAYCEFELKINSWLAHADLSGRMANGSDAGVESSCLSTMIYLLIPLRYCHSSTIVYESIVLGAIAFEFLYALRLAE